MARRAPARRTAFHCPCPEWAARGSALCEGPPSGRPDRGQVLEALGRGLVAAPPGFFETLQDDPAQARRDLRVDRLGIGGRLAPVLEDDAEGRFALEGDAARDHLEKDGAQ